MSAAENSTENSENIVRDGLAIGARLRVAELPDVDVYKRQLVLSTV